MKRCPVLLLVMALLLAACGGAPATPAPTAAPDRQQARALPTATQAETVAVVPTAPPTSAPATTATPADSPTPAATATATEAAVPTETAEPVPTERPTETPEPPTATPEPTATPLPVFSLYARTDSYLGVNLRARTTTDADIVRTIPYGARVRAAGPIEGADGEEWYAVTYRSSRGYVRGDLLTRQRPEPAPSVAPEPPARTIAGSGGPRRPGEWTLTAVGDIMMSRSVLRKIDDYGSYTHPFERTADMLRAADITVANLEGQLSDTTPPSEDPHTFSFVTPTKAAGALKWAGIDAVSLANNHTLDFGTQTLADTMEGLERYDIGYFGAGNDLDGAYVPAIYEVGGQRVALLGFTDLSNAGYPDPSLPTPAPAVSPERVAEAVRAASARADVVIPYFHWGSEYVAVPDGRQRALAYAAVDAGADLVLGAHPHWVQTTERYKDTLIVYSMGNFVFDQEWSRETKQGVIATFAFDGAEVTDVEYTPILIEDYNQPRPATGADYTAVLDRMGVSSRE